MTQNSHVRAVDGALAAGVSNRNPVQLIYSAGSNACVRRHSIDWEFVNCVRHFARCLFGVIVELRLVY